MTYLLYSALIHLHQVNLERKDCALVHNYMLYSCTAPLRWLQLNTSTGAVGTLDKGGQIGDAWGFWGRGWLRGLLPLLFSCLWTNQLECCIASREGVRFTKIYKRTFLTTIPCIRVVNRTKLNLDPPLQVENTSEAFTQLVG